jgi:rhodanese-related sulfurtransferase
MENWATISVVVMLLCFQGVVMQAVKADEGNGLKTIEQLIKDAHEGVSCIGVDEMKERIKKNNKLVLLDVRTKSEYDSAHIKGSAWVERGVAEFLLVRTLPDPNAEIVVYCKKGHRAGLVTKALKKAGYKNVVSLEGGLDEWVHKGNTVHNSLGEFKMVKPANLNAASYAVDFYRNKD